MSPRSIVTSAALLSGLLTAAVGATPQGSSKGRVRTTAEIAAKARPAVVTIETTNAAGGELALGSGFLVAANGIIVTNWHVMAGAAVATVTLTNGDIFRQVAFLDGDPTTDIAILKIPAANLPTLPMTSDTPPVGSRVVALGSPLGLNDTVTEGIVSAVRVVRGRTLVQTTTPIGPGSSGGPLLDSQGAVFAVSTLMLEGAPLMNFGVPARYAIGFMRAGLPERPLADVFHPVAPSRAIVLTDKPAAPGHAARPAPDLSGTYVLSSGVTRSTETARRQLLVAGKDVALLRVDGDVVPVNVLRTNESGEVAFAVGDESFAGYQTEKGFVYFSGRGAEPIVAVRMTEPLASNIGVYVVTSRAISSQDGDRQVTNWSGEAVVIADTSLVSINLRLSTQDGESRGFSARGPLGEHGHFRLVRADGSIEGNITAGVIQATWCPAIDEPASCMPIQARRR